MLGVKNDYKEDVERVTAIVETSLGTFEAELYAKECPETVWNFVNLAEGRQETERGEDFYDGLTFHRVIKNFVIQGGCPTGNGTGGWYPQTRTINWTLTSGVAVGASENFLFRMNCSEDAQEYDLMATTYSEQTGTVEYEDTVNYLDAGGGGGSRPSQNFTHSFTRPPVSSARITQFDIRVQWGQTNLFE